MKQTVAFDTPLLWTMHYTMVVVLLLLRQSLLWTRSLSHRLQRVKDCSVDRSGQAAVVV
jgi:hypothetical protein